MNQDEIMDALEDAREQFLDAIEGLSDEQLEEPGVIGDWSVKHIMTHLSLWEAELVKLLWQAKQGGKPTTIHFTPGDLDAKNEAFHRNNKDRPLERVLDDFAAVRKQTVRRVDGFTDQELTDPKRFSWLKGTPLWKWIAADSFDHEKEHTEQIRAWREKRGI
jgi:hypothetical protein